jgi:hypothetical protein
MGLGVICALDAALQFTARSLECLPFVIEECLPFVNEEIIHFPTQYVGLGVEGPFGPPVMASFPSPELSIPGFGLLGSFLRAYS